LSALTVGQFFSTILLLFAQTRKNLTQQTQHWQYQAGRMAQRCAYDAHIDRPPMNFIDRIYL
jgi:hypothetical protein